MHDVHFTSYVIVHFTRYNYLCAFVFDFDKSL